jgi:hypothetical protein
LDVALIGSVGCSQELPAITMARADSASGRVRRERALHSGYAITAVAVASRPIRFLPTTVIKQYALVKSKIRLGSIGLSTSWADEDQNKEMEG